MPASADIAHALVAQRRAFKAFLTARLGNEADADDVLQASLAKAVRHSGELREDRRVTAWFYRILRRAIVDHVRNRRAALAREQAWAADPAVGSAADAEDERALCRCFEPLLSTLKPRHAELLRLVEFENRSIPEAAATLGISSNSASVTLHRARHELRKRLETFCGDCSRGACLDCDCPPLKPEPRSTRGRAALRLNRSAAQTPPRAARR